MTGTFSQIGRRMVRREDFRLLTGQGRYLDDVVFPGALHAHFIRSPHAHARILRIDADAARAMPGVAAVVTGRDLARWTKPLRMAPPIDGLLPVTVESFPTEKVRFNGDLVACVVADSVAAAEDAAEHIVVDYAPLPAVVGTAEALRENAELVDNDLTSNLVSRQTFRAGETDARFASAYRVVEARFSQSRQTHAPIETRGCCAIWDAGREHLTMHIGNQAPHPYRTQLAARLGLSESSP
jgi:carbon-monoxide dehydrogenase large subunit